MIGTSLQDHEEFRRRAATEPQLRTSAGRVFRSTDSKKLDPVVRKGIVSVKLETSKKAGTASNHRAAAATAWALGNLHNDFAKVCMCWTGAASGVRR